jgi:hypothetical protein
MIVIRIPGEDDHRFRDDRDQLIAIFGTMITMIPERFAQG